MGIAGRLAMRFLALAAGTGRGFSLGGTAEVILTGVLIGSPAALLFLALRGRFPGSGLRKGGLFGALVFAVLVLFPPPAARSALAAMGHLPLALALFGTLFIFYGVILEAAARCWLVR